MGISRFLVRRISTRDAREILRLPEHLVRVSKCDASQPLAHGLKGDRPLSRLEDHPTYAEELLALQGIADHRKRLLAYGIAWCDVVRLLDVPGVDLTARNEPLDVDRARVLDNKPRGLGCGRRHGRGGASARPIRLSERCLADRGR